MPTHRCPAPPCQRQIDEDYLACRRHWHMVPRPVRRAVWIAWDQGNGRGTAAHSAAIAAAVRHLERMTG